MEKRINRILIVDDNPDNIEILTFFLERIPEYKIYTATDGEEALEKLEEVIPDLILLDIVMPKIDGFATAKSLKGNPSTANIPIIFMTSLDDINSKKKAFDIGGVDYITKPFHNNEVLCRIKTHLKLKNVIDELKDALEKVKLLKGLLPICAWCKKIRNDKGYWEQVETFIAHHSEADFTHSICPNCQEKFTEKMNEEEE